MKASNSSSEQSRSTSPGMALDPADSRTMLICGALIGGCLVVMVIATVVTEMNPNWQQVGFMTAMFSLVALLQLPLAFIVPNLIHRVQLRQSPAINPGEIRRAQQRTVDRNRSIGRQSVGGPDGPEAQPSSLILQFYLIRFAILEGAALLLAIAIILEGDWVALFGCVVIVAIMMVGFPYPGRMRDFKDRLSNQLGAG